MSRFNDTLLLLFFIINLFPPFTNASNDNHWYNVGDNVPLFVNKIGPLNNPSETYEYFDLPFCRPGNLVKKKETLGEVLSGDRLTNGLYDLKFRNDKNGDSLCHKKLTRDDIAIFRSAIINDYYFQMYFDDLPLWGFIGRVEDERYFLFKHIQFDALYNENRVIEIRAFSDPNAVTDITEDVETSIQFTYSIFWNSTEIKFEKRMDKYSRASLHPTQRKIHLFSFLNAVVILVLLMGWTMVLFIKHLKNDLKRLSGGDEEEDKEVGWKYIHGDVFRCPPRMHLFCAVLGCGTHLLTLVCLLFALALFQILYPYNRGALSNFLVFIYALTSIISGYTTSTFYNQFAETGWGRSVLLTGVLFVGPVFLTVTIVNTVSIFYGTTSALPVGTILVILILYIFLSVPLIALGGIIGYRFTTRFQAPSATKRVPREIPLPAWHRKTLVQMFIGGLLPFSVIALELHNTYISLWGYKIFTIPSVLFFMISFLIIVVAMLSIGLTYIQLTSEDHEWWWRSLFRGGSTAVFMFGYCLYFYAKSNMKGLLQLSFFFGYSFCICYAFFLLLGTISFFSSYLFVRKIYGAVKNE